MHPALEGFSTVFSDVTNNNIWQAVPFVDCCVDESPTNGDRSGYWYCKSITWHWHAGAGGSSNNIRLRNRSTMVYRAFAGVHFLEYCNCCHLTSMVERWDVQFYPSLIHFYTNNSRCLPLRRALQSKCCWGSTYPLNWCVFHYTPHLGHIDNCCTSSIPLVCYSP